MRAIDSVRTQIEHVDAQLIAMLAKRMELVVEAGRAKRDAGEPVLDPAREAAVVHHATRLAREAGLPTDEVRELFWRIMAMGRRLQTQDGRVSAS